MPSLHVKTTKSEKVWESPDKQRVIYKLELDYEGNPTEAKTYSKDIAEIGWEGDVESYEKEGKFGSETFVKQPQKESGYSGGKSYGASKPLADPYTMYLSYVKDIAVALINTKAYTVERLNEVANDVATTGEMFYEMRPEGDTTPKVEAGSDADLLANIDKVFTEDEEEPWQEPGKLPVTQ